MLKKLLLGTFLSLLWTVGVHAADLTSEQVGRFLAAIEDLQVVSEEHNLSDQVVPGAGSLSNIMERASQPFTSSLAEIEGKDGYDEMVDVVEQHGFQGASDWAAVGDQVFRAYAALKMAEQEPELDSKMAEALAQLESSTMPEAQKEMMREMLKASSQFLAVYADVSEADKAAVRPHVSALESLE